MSSRSPVFVTGASSDLGVALVRKIAARPDPPKIVAHCRQGRDRLLLLAEDIGEDRIAIEEADFTSESAVIALAERSIATHGAPSELVHLPALPLVYERFPKFDWARFQTDMDVQVKSAVLLLQRFLPRMTRMPRAKVVFVLSSVTRGLPPKFLSMYSICKHAQLGLMKALASEYAGTSVTVNAVSPSMIETRFLAAIPEVAVQMAAAASPKKRNATPEDVVGAIEFLLSEASDFMTGAELPVTAGSTA